MNDNIKTPDHIAIILDGNGRWAKERGKTRSYGHEVGFNNVKSIAFYASDLGVKALSLYCFSTENWNRPSDEVRFLMSIPSKFYNDGKAYKDKNIKVIVSGRKDRIPDSTYKALSDLMNDTKDSTGMILNICFDYGALNDIYSAVNTLVSKGESLKDEKDIYNHLSTKGLPLIDLLIRTGGEKRLSNFLLLEASYAELYFTDIYWPDFKEEDLMNAIKDYSNRNRRFGGIKE